MIIDLHLSGFYVPPVTAACRGLCELAVCPLYNLDDYREGCWVVGQVSTCDEPLASGYRDAPSTCVLDDEIRDMFVSRVFAVDGTSECACVVGRWRGALRGHRAVSRHSGGRLIFVPAAPATGVRYWLRQSLQYLGTETVAVVLWTRWHLAAGRCLNNPAYFVSKTIQGQPLLRDFLRYSIY